MLAGGEEQALKFLTWSACMNSQSLSTQENGQTLLSGPTNFGTNLSTKLKIRPKLINANEYDSAALLFNFARLSSLSLIIEGNNYFLENRRK